MVVRLATERDWDSIMGMYAHARKIMQKVVADFGFWHCGTIYVRDHSPRLAYEYVQEVGK